MPLRFRAGGRWQLPKLRGPVTRRQEKGKKGGGKGKGEKREGLRELQRDVVWLHIPVF